MIALSTNLALAAAELVKLTPANIAIMTASILLVLGLCVFLLANLA